MLSPLFSLISVKMSWIREKQTLMNTFLFQSAENKHTNTIKVLQLISSRLLFISQYLRFIRSKGYVDFFQTLNKSCCLVSTNFIESFFRTSLKTKKNPKTWLWNKPIHHQELTFPKTQTELLVMKRKSIVMIEELLVSQKKCV